MRPRPAIELPGEVREKNHRATVIQRWSLAFMISCCIVIYFSLGQSQAMKAVFVEDIFAVIPPLAYLIAQKVRWREPNERFPYGYQGSVTIASVGSALTLLALGVFVLMEALKTLVTREHPTIGVVSLFGNQVWLGWIMIPALIYTMIGEYSFGRLKTPYGDELHDTALAADARMNRADWMSGGSAILGVLGIARGWWWADAVAATIIGIEIVRDGIENVSAGMHDLMDEAPEPVGEGDEEDWEKRLRERVAKLDWVRDVGVRLREEGNMITGEVFVVPRTTEDLPKRMPELQRVARELDWRFYDLMLVPVEKL
jgi:cation diffusion facilitator family transporter